MTDDAKVDTATKKLRKESVFFNNKLAVKERLQWKSAKGVPILKNGTYVKTPITIAGIKFSPTKTCPIDSLVQAILIAATDNKSVEEFVRITPFFKNSFSYIYFFYINFFFLIKLNVEIRASCFFFVLLYNLILVTHLISSCSFLFSFAEILLTKSLHLILLLNQ